MILPDPEALEQRRRGYVRRGAVMVLAVVLMAASALTPHVGVTAFDGYGRWLIGATRFFVAAQPYAEGFGGADTGAVAVALNVTYLGLAAQQVGLLFGLGSFWVLAAAHIGRWTQRLPVISGWFLLGSAGLTTTGYRLLVAAGVPSQWGLAWLFTLLAGLLMVVAGRAARHRIDNTWYIARPELNG